MSVSRTEYTFKPFKVIEVKYRGTEKPKPRSGHRIACDDAHIYCFGGYNPSLSNLHGDALRWIPTRTLFKELWSFSIASRKWKKHEVNENMPNELASNAMCMNGRYLMIFGGTGEPFGETCSNDVIVWRTCQDDAQLRKLEVTGNKPPGLYGQAVLCHEGYFYTIGGTNGYSYNCDIYRLDLRTMVWESVFVGTGGDGEPPGRYRHEAVRVGNKIYVIGGGSGEQAFQLMEIPMYDLDKRAWTILTPKPDDSTTKVRLPHPRKCHSLAQIDTPNGVQVFVAGGTDGRSVLNDIWRLDMSDLQWHWMRKTVVPTPIYFHSSTVTSYGCMYIFGGIEPKFEGTTRNNIMYKVWLCIPKLSEMCWEALLNSHPNLNKLDRETLLNIGIPLHFVSRIHLEPSYFGQI